MASRLSGRLDAARRRRFVGRAAERDLFGAAIAATELPFNVLYVFGLGGVGMTSLLRELGYVCERADIPAGYLDVSPP